MKLLLSSLLVLPLIAVGCDSGDVHEIPDTPVAPVDTASEDVPPPEDTAAPDTSPPGDAGPDTVDTGPPVFEPAPFQVGVGRVRMPVPLGIGTAGFGQFGGGGGPKSRFAEGYPATQAIYTHPTFHTVFVRGADGDLALLRADLIGITQEARRGVIARVLERGGPDLSQGLVISATHTHSGPGRLIDNEIWAAIADKFFPEFYNRMVDAMADSILLAIDDLEPGRFGYAVLDTDALHSDRRCENPDLVDGRLPVLRFDRADGKLKALVLMYAVHSTVIGSGRHTLSRDFHGGMELKLEEQLDHPVTVLFFNSWSGDMSPKGGEVDDHLQVDPDFNRIEAAGNLLGDIVTTALPDIDTTDQIVVRSGIARVPLNREVLGYEPGVFTYEHGAVYCGGTAEVACFGEGDPPHPLSLANGCIGFPDTDPAPANTIVGMFQLGDLYLATMPGEPVTDLGQSTIGRLAEATGQEVYLLGYAQDYVGYSLREEDWYRGGYEASGSLWGPKQGDYLGDRTVEFGRHFITGEPLAFESLPDTPALTYDPPPFPVEPALEPAAIISQPAPVVAEGDIATVVFAGGDPWLLAPTVTLEKQSDDGSFAPLLRKNGLPVSTDGYEFETTLEVSPSYSADKGPIARTFSWTVHLPTLRPAGSTTPNLAGGTYRLRVQGLQDHDLPYELTTDPFTVQ